MIDVHVLSETEIARLDPGTRPLTLNPHSENHCYSIVLNYFLSPRVYYHIYSLRMYRFTDSDNSKLYLHDQRDRLGVDLIIL